MSNVNHAPEKKQLKGSVVTLLKIAGLLILNLVAVSFLMGFGAGVAAPAEVQPTLTVFAFVGACAWVSPFNYYLLKKMF